MLETEVQQERGVNMMLGAQGAWGWVSALSLSQTWPFSDAAATLLPAQGLPWGRLFHVHRLGSDVESNKWNGGMTSCPEIRVLIMIFLSLHREPQKVAKPTGSLAVLRVTSGST